MENEKRTRSGSKRYYWMRLKADFFESPEIRKLRKLAGGDTYTIIYLKMMLKTITNSGMFIYQGIEDTFEKEVALIIDEDENNVMMTIAYLRKHNLLEEGCSENAYLLNAVPELIGSETADAERKRIARSMDPEVVTEIAAEDTLTDNVRQLSENVRTLSDREEQNRIEQNREEIDIDQNKNRVQRMICGTFASDPVDSEELAWTVTRKMNGEQYAAFYSLMEKMKRGELNTSKDDLYRYFNKLSERDWKDSNGKPIRDLVKYVQTNFALNGRSLN
ncbi:MAG: phage replisome organizer N-terminal domain-containing protein [Erysipelotrichaceae bacterium]|nr:phage replisome organizer N-terminal domain-containing protein [Erysipelotrichaceae bacterium]